VIVVLECIERFSIRGGPLYTKGEKVAFEDNVATVLLRDHSFYWKETSIVREAAPLVTAAPKGAPKDRMLRSGHIKGSK
jgi:hypothetical protein